MIFKKFFTLLLAVAVLITQAISVSAASFYVDYIDAVLAPAGTPTSFSATYTFNTHPQQATKLYAWIGEASAPFSEWSKGSYLGQITPNSTLPFSIEKTFNFSDYNIVPGKIYGYALADKGSENGAMLFNVPNAPNLYNCFTTVASNVPCSTQTQGAQNNQTVNQNTNTNNPSTPPTASGENIGNTTFNLFLSSVVPTTDGANITIRFQTKDLNLKNIGLAVFAGETNTNPVPYQKVKEIWSGMIDDETISFQLTGLKSNTQYSYKFVENQTNSEFGPRTFITLPVSNPAFVQGTGGGLFNNNLGALTSNPVPGKCGNMNAASNPSLSQNSIGLCEVGSTVVSFTTTADGKGWTWTCNGQNGGAPASCSATLDATAEYGSSFLKNPFKGIDSFPKLFEVVVNNIVLPIAIPFIALMTIYSGFLFVMARKDGKVYSLEKAKSTFKYTMIGAVLILGAFVIANALQGTLNALLQ